MGNMCADLAEEGDPVPDDRIAQDLGMSRRRANAHHAVGLINPPQFGQVADIDDMGGRREPHVEGRQQALPARHGHGVRTGVLKRAQRSRDRARAEIADVPGLHRFLPIM